MFTLEILLLGLALAIDAAVVTFALGLLQVHLSKGERVKRGLMITLAFGIFQFLMLWAGSYAGYLFTFSSYGYLFQFVVATIFFLIAFKFVQESLNEEDRDLEWGLMPLILLGFATSIDALVSGVSFGTLPQPYFAAGSVGIVTFLVCGLFYLISQFFQKIPDKWLLRFAGLIFIILGAEIVLAIFYKRA
ncbi:manganese efflux pump MntP family protein [Peredibacter sp. HCB2-198]|uniref:manganese efflux pump MntP n=1 Tax=Peredibacter sp. HCB2-198 TaxID=3383025 RepID=UPI0038B58344